MAHISIHTTSVLSDYICIYKVCTYICIYSVYVRGYTYIEPQLYNK